MMPRFKDLDNPFTVQSPESLSAEDAHLLFVEVFTDFPGILTPGHTFLHGPRGSGKSMMFRYLLPDCQFLAKRSQKLKDLPFFAVWIRLKNTDLKITDLARLEDIHASSIINEHLMVIHFAEKVFDSVLRYAMPHGNFELEEVISFFNNFVNYLECCGWEKDDIGIITTSPGACFESMKQICRSIYSHTLTYLKKLSFVKEPMPYQGPLCGYLDFLYPVLCGLKSLSIMPESPIFLLIDDADNLNMTQTKILNSWVYTRTQENVSIKISTQMRYKTYKTINEQTIQTPHDFSETNISTVYTSSAKDKYPERIEEIIKKRFALFGINKSPKEFFPTNEDQENKIQEIYDKYKMQNTSNAQYDAYRYARPDYMKSLAGASKSKYSYSYSGFKQLVDISSGIIRFFLEPAYRMYNKMKSISPEAAVDYIPDGIQNTVIREYSDEFILSEYDRLRNDKSIPSEKMSLFDKLFNFIEVLGGTFAQILLSDRSERRVISFVFYNKPSDELLEIINLGVEYGYFHVSTIGNKQGTGRVRQYILSRRLAPHYYLDPSGFSGYLFLGEDQIWDAINHPTRILRRVREEGAESVFEKKQTLFD